MFIFSIGKMVYPSKKDLRSKYQGYDDIDLHDIFNKMMPTYFKYYTDQAQHQFILECYDIKFLKIEEEPRHRKYYLIYRMEWAIRIKEEGTYKDLWKSFYGQGAAGKTWYNTHPDQYLALETFIYIRKKYINIEDFWGITHTLRTKRQVEAVEQHKCNNPFTIQIYIDLVKALDTPMGELTITYDYYKKFIVEGSTATNKGRTIKDVPREWAQWGLKVEDMGPIIDEYKKIRATILDMSQTYFGRESGMAQAHVSLLENHHKGSRGVFTKYCYHVARLQQEATIQ